MARALLLLLFLVLAGCSAEAPPGSSAASEPASLTTKAEEAVAVAADELASGALASPVAEVHELRPPPGEPPEAALRKLEFQRYEMIEKAGGIPVTITATGRQLVLKPKLYSVRKKSCRPTPQAPDGWYECSLTISLSLAEDGSDPAEQGERIGVKWDGSKAEWVLQ